MRTEHYWDVKTIGTRVRLSWNFTYDSKQHINVDAIHGAVLKHGVNFNKEQYHTYVLNDYPYLNLHALKGWLNKDLDWYIADKEPRDKLVKALKAIGPMLMALGVIDKVALDASKVAKSIAKSRSTTPILDVGGKRYRMTLVEDPITPDTLAEELQQELESQLSSMEAGYNDAVRDIKALANEEIERIKSQNKHPYELSMADIRAGWTTWMEGNNPMLGLRTEFAPTHVLSGGKHWIIKDEIREKFKTPMVLVYNGGYGAVTCRTEDLSDHMPAPHCYERGGICTGSYHFPPKTLDTKKAMEIVETVEEILRVINFGSLVNYEFKGYRLSDSFLRDYCIDPEAAEQPSELLDVVSTPGYLVEGAII